jgi:hypothetical protein
MKSLLETKASWPNMICEAAKEKVARNYSNLSGNLAWLAKNVRVSYSRTSLFSYPDEINISLFFLLFFFSLKLVIVLMSLLY